MIVTLIPLINYICNNTIIVVANTQILKTFFEVISYGYVCA